MAYTTVEKPIPGPYCFGQSDDASILSQAAVLLATGFTLRGDDVALTERATAAGIPDPLEFAPREDAEIFPVPRVTGIAGRQNTRQTRVGIELRYGAYTLRADNSETLHKKVIPDLAERHFKQPTVQSASELMEASLSNDAEIVRVAAASAYFELSAETDRLLNILAQGTTSNDELTREVAATALANVAPTHPALEMFRRSAGAGAAAAGATTLLIHGTWAANEPWWQPPNGDFFQYVLANVRKDLYNQPDRFGWSGVYSDAARLQASQDLMAWMASHNEDAPDMITHSHGGSVAFLATQAGQTMGELIVLSCPVHLPKYLPDFSKIKKTVSIRVHMDLVLLADRSGQKFTLPQIQENVLPVWFDHSKTHDPATWQKYNVKSML